MRQFIFKPGYYEWHLTDKATGKTLHVMSDPADLTVHDDGTPLTLEELEEVCMDDLETAEFAYTVSDIAYNGIRLHGGDLLTKEEMTDASKTMAKALYGFYIDGPEPEGELKF